MAKKSNYIIRLMITNIIYYMLEEGYMDTKGKLFIYLHFVPSLTSHPVSKIFQYCGEMYFGIGSIVNPP